MEAVVVLLEGYDFYYNLTKMSNQSKDINCPSNPDSSNNSLILLAPKPAINLLPTITVSLVDGQGRQVSQSSSSIATNSSTVCTTSNTVKDCLSSSTEYTYDILRYLVEIEQKRKPMYFKSPQICFRPSLVELIRKSGEILKLCRTTVHLAIYLTDMFMDSYKVPIYRMNLLALVCVLLASKVEEKDLNIPKIIQLNTLVGNTYTTDDFKSLERRLLLFFDFGLLYPTIVNFIEIYFDHVYTLEDYQTNDDGGNSKYMTELMYFTYNTTLTTLQNLLFEFTDVVLQDHRLVHQKPSLMAAACLGAARKTMNIYPVWSNRLKILTSYELDELNEYIDVLTFCRESILGTGMVSSNRKIKSTPDSGYLSESRSDDTDVDVDTTPPPVKKRRIF